MSAVLGLGSSIPKAAPSDSGENGLIIVYILRLSGDGITLFSRIWQGYFRTRLANSTHRFCSPGAFSRLGQAADQPQRRTARLSLAPGGGPFMRGRGEATWRFPFP